MKRLTRTGPMLKLLRQIRCNRGPTSTKRSKISQAASAKSSSKLPQILGSCPEEGPYPPEIDLVKSMLKLFVQIQRKPLRQSRTDFADVGLRIL